MTTTQSPPRSQYFVLTGRASTAILEARGGGAPLWRYWGPRLAVGALPPSPASETRPIPSFALDADQPFSIFPMFGAGWFGASALLAHRAGRSFAQAATDVRLRWTAPGVALECEIEDSVARLRVIVRLALDPASDVLTASSEIVNDGDGALDVHWLAAAALPLPDDAQRIRYFSGRHNREFVDGEDALSASLWRRENRRGLTSHDCFPGGVVLCAGAAADGGLAYGAQLAWSGSHAQLIERLDDGRRQWQAGEYFAPGEVSLAPGERLASPEFIATVSDEGANGVARNFHQAIRSRMTWPKGPMTPRKVHINTWEAFYFDHRLDALKRFADDAASLGAERFVLDDGWFKGRNNDRASLGDWRADAAKYPDGLAPLIDHVAGLGMDFGLWVEPEMVNPDSDLYRAHPDWALALAGRQTLTGRNQLVLDLARPEVSDYLFMALDALLGGHAIAYLKWDHNRDLTTAGGADGRAAYRGQTQALYALMARLRRAHPHVEIEACAGGGGRIDAGIVRFAHRFWTSDCLDAVERLGIQRGFLQFFPPELMGAHVGASPSHATGRTQNLDFRAAVATPGHFGVELDPSRLNDGERETLKAWISFYKRHRDLLHGGEVFLGDGGDGVVWQAHGAADRFIVFVYRNLPTRERQPPSLRLPFADRRRQYRLALSGAPGAPTLPPSPFFSSLRGSGVVVDGGWLASAGLPLPPMMAESALILMAEALA